MSRLRVGRSYWLDTFTGTTPRPGSLHGHHRADVVVVGAGITGCAAALLFARAGASVIVIDAERIGRGSTAASTALLMQEPDVDFADMTARLGAGPARRVWNDCRAAVKNLVRTLEDAGAPAVHRLPSLYFTRDEQTAEKLQREVALRARAHLPGRWLTPRTVSHLAGFESSGAILTRGNAQVDPYRGCLAVATAAAAAGARFYERSKASRIHGTRDGVRVTLPHAEIEADWAVLASGYATPAFKPLAARFRMMNTYVIATPRLTRSQARAVGLGDVMLWDTERPYHYLRWTPDGRLLFGGRDRVRVPRQTRASVLHRLAAELMTDLRGLFPALGDVAPAYAWEGLFATTPDGLPYIGTHRRYPRHLFALGYGGNGMTLGYLAAELLVRHVAGRPSRDDALFAFGRRANLHRRY